LARPFIFLTKTKEKTLENNGLACFFGCSAAFFCILFQWVKPHCEKAWRSVNPKMTQREIDDRNEIRDVIFKLSRAIAREEERERKRAKGANCKKRGGKTKKIMFH